jgi:hypothetical protein
MIIKKKMDLDTHSSTPKTSGMPSGDLSIVDFYHVTEHLQTFADAAFNDEKERKDWFKKALKTLKKGNAWNLMKQMDEFILEATGERCKIMESKRENTY